MEIIRNAIPGNTSRSSKILQKNGYIEISRKDLGRFKVIIYEKMLNKTMFRFVQILLCKNFFYAGNVVGDASIIRRPL